MFTVVMMAAGLAAGYTVTVVLSMLTTFAITMALPKFVEADYLVRNGYKLVHEALWLLCAFAGGYVTSLVCRGVHTMVTEGLLAASLIWILWDNSWEARQRGIAHQMLISLFTLAGVAGGYMLQRQMI